MEQFKFSSDQTDALDAILEWYKLSNDKAFAFGGAAGTGKSTIISHIQQLLPMSKIVYCAYTGKATTVLRRKLMEMGIAGDSVSTIHGLLYAPVIDPDTKEILRWDKRPRIGADLIIVDEASMVPADIFEDLVSYGIPILFVGDHYQLPPVSEYDFNLMESPDVKLEKPHRFAENSPIIKLSTRIRNRDTLKYGKYGANIIKRRLKNITPTERDLFFQSDQLKTGDAIIICGFNKTRIGLNSRVRSHFGFKGLINNDERIICLRNNKRTNIPLFNGSIGTIKYINRHQNSFKAAVVFDDYQSPFNGKIFNDIFGMEKPDIHARARSIQCFDYGYAISCHKSQGSSWNRVCVFDEQCQLWDQHRWLYTAVTRAERELLIVSH